MTAEDEIYADARKAIEALRKAAWKGELRGVKRAMETLERPMREFIEQWATLENSHLSWRQLQDGEVEADRDDLRADLEGDLNHFDEVLKILLGPSEFELKQLAEE